MRNRLVHGFFTVNIRRVMEPKGRLEIEKELKEMTIEIRNRDKIVCSLIDKYLRKYKLSTEDLAKRPESDHGARSSVSTVKKVFTAPSA